MGRLDDEHIGGKFLLLLGDVLTTLLLTLGTALAWLSVYILPGDPLMDLGAVIACCAAASVASAALLTWRHGLWAALALLAAGGLTCWRLWEKLAEGWLPGRSPSLLDLLDKYPAALYLLCALLALVMGLAAVKARAWYLAALLSIAPVLPDHILIQTALNHMGSRNVLQLKARSGVFLLFYFLAFGNLYIFHFCCISCRHKVQIHKRHS